MTTPRVLDTSGRPLTYVRAGTGLVLLIQGAGVSGMDGAAIDGRSGRADAHWHRAMRRNAFVELVLRLSARG